MATPLADLHDPADQRWAQLFGVPVLKLLSANPAWAERPQLLTLGQPFRYTETDTAISLHRDRHGHGARAAHRGARHARKRLCAARLRRRSRIAHPARRLRLLPAHAARLRPRRPAAVAEDHAMFFGLGKGARLEARANVGFHPSSRAKRGNSNLLTCMWSCGSKSPCLPTIVHGVHVLLWIAFGELRSGMR